MIEKDLLYDKRILERNLEKGLITRDDYTKFIAKLDDLAQDFSEVNNEVKEGEFDLGARELSDEERLEQEGEIDG